MPNSQIVITEGSGTNVDTRTTATDGDHRQVVILGDPSVDAGIAEVLSVPPGESATNYGIATRVLGSIRVHQATAGTFAVFFDQSNPSVNIGGASLGVFFDGSEPAIGSITSSVAIYFDRGEPTVRASTTGTQAVYFDQSAPTVTAVQTGTFGVFFDGSEPTVRASSTGTQAVYFDQSNPAVNITSIAAGDNNIGNVDIVTAPILNISATAIVPQTASGTVSSQGGSGLNTVVSPESSRLIKVYAFSLTTTGQVNNNVRFTDGSSEGSTEYWRVAMEAPAQGIAGANLAVTPPGYLFAAAANTTIALFLGEASLIHYSVAYFKETA